MEGVNRCIMGNVGLCVFDGISASFASILAFIFPSSSLKCSETSLEFFFHLNMSTPNLTLKKLKAHYAGFASCFFLNMPDVVSDPAGGW